MNSYFIKLILIRIKYFAKNWVILVCLIVSLIISCLYAYTSQDKEDKNRVFNIAIVDYDDGDLSKSLIADVKKIDNLVVHLLDEEKAMRQLSVNAIDGVFVINNNFSEEIYNHEYKDLITSYIPVSLSSAAPVGDYISTQVMYIWLKEYFIIHAKDVYENSENKQQVDLQQILKTIDNPEDYKKIINIIHYDLSTSENNQKEPEGDFLFNVTGIFACFVFFAVAYSSEWVFTLKKKALRLRLDMMNISITSVCIASIIACIILCVPFYIIMLLSIQPILNLTVPKLLVSAAYFLVYLIGIGGLSFVITYAGKDSNQFIILTTVAGLLHISLTGLLTPLPEWAKLSRTLSYVLPGTQLVRNFSQSSNIMFSLIVSSGWILLAMVILMIANKKAGKSLF